MYIYIIYIIDLIMEHIYMRIQVGKWSIDLLKKCQIYVQARAYLSLT